jgi:hypothetical protein
MFIHNLLNVLVQTANKMGLRKKVHSYTGTAASKTTSRSAMRFSEQEIRAEAVKVRGRHDTRLPEYQQPKLLTVYQQLPCWMIK